MSGYGCFFLFFVLPKWTFGSPKLSQCYWIPFLFYDTSHLYNIFEMQMLKSYEVFISVLQLFTLWGLYSCLPTQKAVLSLPDRARACSSLQTFLGWETDFFLKRSGFQNSPGKFTSSKCLKRSNYKARTCCPTDSGMTTNHPSWGTCNHIKLGIKIVKVEKMKSPI